MKMIEIDIEQNLNTQESETRNFMSKERSYPIQEMQYISQENHKIHVELTGWNHGKASQAYATKVEDSGDGEAWLIYGGNEGLRLRKKIEGDNFVPFSIENKDEWGELYLYYNQDLYQDIIAPYIRPFRILGIQQIAIGAPNKTMLKDLWKDLLGLQNIHHFKSEKENVNEDIFQLGIAPFTTELDLMEPINIENKPKIHEPPLNHIGLWVDDIHIAYEYLQKKGVRFAPGGIRKGAIGQDVCFIHPKPNEEFPISGCGVLIELVQATKEILLHYEKLA